MIKRARRTYPPIELKDIQDFVRNILDRSHLLNMWFTNIDQSRCAPEKNKSLAANHADSFTARNSPNEERDDTLVQFSVVPYVTKSNKTDEDPSLTTRFTS